MTVSICNYICPDAMKDLCMHLDLPEEVTERLVYHVKTMDLYNSIHILKDCFP